MHWYVFKPEGNDVSDPDQYKRVENTPPTSVGPKNHLHAIWTKDDNGKPVLTDIDLMMEIVDALRNKKESTNVLLRTTK